FRSAVLRRRGPSLPVPGVAVLVLQRREAARGRLGRRLGGRGTDRTGLRGPLGAVVAGGGRDGGCRRRGVGPHAGADAGLTEQTHRLAHAALLAQQPVAAGDDLAGGGEVALAAGEGVGDEGEEDAE